MFFTNHDVKTEWDFSGIWPSIWDFTIDRRKETEKKSEQNIQSDNEFPNKFWGSMLNSRDIQQGPRADWPNNIGKRLVDAWKDGRVSMNLQSRDDCGYHPQKKGFAIKNLSFEHQNDDSTITHEHLFINQLLEIDLQTIKIMQNTNLATGMLRKGCGSKHTWWSIWGGAPSPRQQT